MQRLVTYLAVVAIATISNGCTRFGFGPAEDPSNHDGSSRLDAASEPVDAVAGEESAPVLPDGGDAGETAPDDATSTVQNDAEPVIDAPAAPGPPCRPGSGALATETVGKTAVCTVTQSRNQCSASDLCNAAEGWKLCTAGEYQARFPVSGEPPPEAFSAAWIGGCITASGSPADRFDKQAPCSACSGGLAFATLSWPCSGGGSPPGPLSPRLGVQVGLTCRRIGENTVSEAGYWIAVGSEATVNSALCCRP